MVGRIAAYESQMNTALAIRDRSERNAAIVAAREQLAESANKPLTAGNIARVDAMLGIRGASPQLGAERSRSSDRNRDFSRVSFDDRRDGRRDRDFFGHHHHGLSTPVDPARIEARATVLDARATAVNARFDDRVEALQAIAAYDRAMIAAMALDDPTAQTAAISAARSDLRAAMDRPLSGRTIDRLYDRLGLEDTPSAVASRGSIAMGLDG